MMNDEIVLPGIGKVKVRRGKNIRFLSVRIAPGRGVWVNVPFGVSGRQVEAFYGSFLNASRWFKASYA